MNIPDFTIEQARAQYMKLNTDRRKRVRTIMSFLITGETTIESTAATFARTLRRKHWRPSEKAFAHIDITEDIQLAAAFIKGRF